MKVDLRDGYFISTDKNLLDVALIHSYLSEESYWAKNIPLQTVQRSIDNSLCFGMYKEQQQIGFARVVTDTATFAYLADVFIVERERGKGLSKELMKVIMSYPDLQGLRRWMLGTRDAHNLYKQFGWQPLTNVERFMQVHNPHVYTASK